MTHCAIALSVVYLLILPVSVLCQEIPPYHPVIELHTNHPFTATKEPGIPASSSPLIPTDDLNRVPKNSLQSEDSVGPGNTQPGVSITYHGGPIMKNPIGVYLLYYGLWDDTSKACIRDFLSSVTSLTNQPLPGNSVAANSVAEWWNVVQLYGDGQGRHVSAYVSIVGEADLGEPFGSGQDASLGENVIANIVHYAILGDIAEANGEAIYVVLTAPGVNVSNTCAPGGECAYHNFYRYTYRRHLYPSTIKFIWIGNPASPRCRASVCVLPIGAGYSFPNRQSTLDSLVNNLGEQLASTATNPTFTSWYSTNDTSVICKGQFGRIQLLVPKGGKQSILFTVSGANGRHFLIPTIFNPFTAQCVNGITIPPSRCGSSFSNSSCPPGLCCSNQGWCGFGLTFCSNQNCYSGACTPSPPPPPSIPPSPTPSLLSPLPLKPLNSPPPPPMPVPAPSPSPHSPTSPPSSSSPPPPTLQFGPRPGH